VRREEGKRRGNVRGKDEGTKGSIFNAELISITAIGAPQAAISPEAHA
jgi:hypothetical protein